MTWVVWMDSSSAYMLAADAVLLVHALFVVFVLLSLVAIFAGSALRWGWVRNPWFRLIHLIAVAVVVIQSWLAVICPLTTLEMIFRNRAGDAVYPGSFIGHWLERLLYYEAPSWVFVMCYTAFGTLVLVSWFWVRPRSFQS
jgi:hypothetical protein